MSTTHHRERLVRHVQELERLQDLKARAADDLKSGFEVAAADRGLYQQTERLGRLVIEHAPAPRAPHRSCQLVWPATTHAPADAAGYWTARES